MSEPSYRPPLSITLHDVRTGPPHEGERGEGVMLLTDRGNWHRARCWWCMGKPTRGSHTPAGCTFTTGPRSRNSSSSTRAPSIASMNVPPHSNSS
jgi:hypothetical protein